MLPFSICGSIASLCRLWLTPFPFKRREVFAIIEPVHGREAARQYFAGLRFGFLRGRGFSGRFFVTLGLMDGDEIRRDPAQWTRIVQSRASRPIKIA